MKQILESEGKPKVVSQRKLRPTKHGEFTVNWFPANVNCTMRHQTYENVDTLQPGVEELENIAIVDEETKVLVCIASQTRKTVVQTLRKGGHCVECEEMLQAEDAIARQRETGEMLSYVNHLNRRGSEMPLFHCDVLVWQCPQTFSRSG